MILDLALWDGQPENQAVARHAREATEAVLAEHGMSLSDWYSAAAMRNEPERAKTFRRLLDDDAFFQALRIRLDEIRRRGEESLLFGCATCREMFPSSKLGRINAPGAFGQFCRPCLEQEQKRQADRLAKRGIRSALARARATGLVANLTELEWRETLDRFGDACAYCGGQWYVVEHATPIELGGGTTISNCLPSCFACNFRKGKRTLEGWIRDVPADGPSAALEWLRGLRGDQVAEAVAAKRRRK